MHTAPSAVRNLIFTYNGSHFNITWVEPLHPNGMLNYSVGFTGVSLVTFEEVVSLSEVVTETQFQPSQIGNVYTWYQVIVTPQTGGGIGPIRSAIYVTPEGSK